MLSENVIEPLAHLGIDLAQKALLRQDDCDPYWEECDDGADAYGDEYDVEAMDEEMEQEEELPLQVSPAIAAMAVAFNALSIGLVGSIYKDMKDMLDESCAEEAD